MEIRKKSCCCGTKSKKSIYDIEVMAQGNNPVKLDDYKGKVLLVVNTASKCGFTPQYDDLEAINKRFSERGFAILDFPCNQFGNQSPESDAETTQFCQLNYGTTFPQFKILRQRRASVASTRIISSRPSSIRCSRRQTPTTPRSLISSGISQSSLSTAMAM